MDKIIEKEIGEIIEALNGRIEKHDDSKNVVQEKLHEVCDRMRKQIDDLELKISSELEENYTKEDEGLQNVLAELHAYTDEENRADPEEAEKAIQSAKNKLIIMQTYKMVEHKFTEEADIPDMLELKVIKQIVPEWIYLKPPTEIRAVLTDDTFYVYFNVLAVNGCSPEGIRNNFTYKALLYKKDADVGDVYPLEKAPPIDGDPYIFTPAILEENTEYVIRVAVSRDGKDSEWSDPFEFKSTNFSKMCIWKHYNDCLDASKRYIVDCGDHRLAKFVGDSNCTIIGNTTIPLNKVTTWTVKILTSLLNNGCAIFVGVAPVTINRSEDSNHVKCGWYYNCYSSSLFSGPPHNCHPVPYGPQRDLGSYIRMNDTVGVMMDTHKRELSFIINGVNYGAAYLQVPLDVPLVPCVILGCKYDSVKIDPLGGVENVNPFHEVPAGVVAQSDSWHSATIKWDPIAAQWNLQSPASFYQIEMDGTVQQFLSTNSVTKRRLLPETTHTFRVRAVRYGSVSKWSNMVSVKTLRPPEFTESGWKECPDKNAKEYSLNILSSKVVTRNAPVLVDWCTVIGTSPVPPDGIRMWTIKIKKMTGGLDNDIFVGITPFDVIQTENQNYVKYGWYFSCAESNLYSGYPHNYRGKEYGQRKKRGEYVYRGDSVGVIADTINGELSFALNGVDLGVAYEGIPLDKPIVPCVILKEKGDSVELAF